MTYKEALQFVSKCLTLGICPERKPEIVDHIRAGKVTWEQIVAVSSGQFVLPALFVRFQNVDILNELPPDLVEYMEYLTQINRERNIQLLNQLNDINQLMASNGIEAVFLKGSAHLLTSLYDDIAERMVGDIDFLVPEADYFKALELLLNTGYKPIVEVNNEMAKTLKHYPRLTNYNYPAAVEVHRQVIAPPYHRYFDAGLMLAAKQKLNLQQTFYIPSVSHLIIHNALNVQINDKSYKNTSINLRQLYDLLLLSKQANPQTVLSDFGKLPKHTNAYLATASLFFNVTALIQYNPTTDTKRFLKRFNFFIDHPGRIYTAYKTSLYLIERLSRYVVLPFQSFYKKDVRIGLWYRLSNPKWYRSHFFSYWDYFFPKR